MGFSRQEYSRRVGCHSLLQGIFLIQVLNPSLLHLLHWQAGSFSTSATWKVRSYHGGGGLVAKSFLTLVTPGTIACQAPLSMGFSTDKNTGVDCHFLLQGIFQTQGSNLGLLHCKKILYRLSYKGYHMTQQKKGYHMTQQKKGKQDLNGYLYTRVQGNITHETQTNVHR